MAVTAPVSIDSEEQAMILDMVRQLVKENLKDRVAFGKPLSQQQGLQ
jgi:hypothetical protein